MFDVHPWAFFDLSDITADDTAGIYDALAAREDDDVQVQLERHGLWHRQTNDRRATACGLTIRPPSAMGPVGWFNLRRHDYGGELCPDCHTPFELTLSEKANTEGK